MGEYGRSILEYEFLPFNLFFTDFVYKSLIYEGCYFIGYQSVLKWGWNWKVEETKRNSCFI